MAYNNEITYAEKWATPENKKALKDLQDLYFDRSNCYPDCPVAWAPEVLDLLTKIDKAYGIRYNTSTMRGFTISDITFGYFLIKPIQSAIRSFKSNFIDVPEYKYQKENRAKPIIVRLKAVVYDSFAPVRYGINALKIKFINPILNKIYKPEVSLDQIKEKYGELRLYYSAPEYAEQYIDYLIAETEVKLAMKGAYYPVESLYNASRSAPFHEDIIDVRGRPYVTTHRSAMVNLGLDLKEVENKYKESNKKGEDAT